MTFTTRFRLGAAALVTGAALVAAVPAWAAAPAQTDPTPPPRLAELKAKADEAVKARLTQVDTAFRSHAESVALVGECSTPVVTVQTIAHANIAR